MKLLSLKSSRKFLRHMCSFTSGVFVLFVCCCCLGGGGGGFVHNIDKNDLSEYCSSAINKNV